jgi:hypothetical protein
MLRGGGVSGRKRTTRRKPVANAAETTGKMRSASELGAFITDPAHDAATGGPRPALKSWPALIQ